HGRLGDAAGFGCPSEMPLLCERQQKFKLVDQGDGPRKCSGKGGRPVARNSTDRRPSIRQKRRPAGSISGAIRFSYRLISQPYQRHGGFLVARMSAAISGAALTPSRISLRASGLQDFFPLLRACARGDAVCRPMESPPLPSLEPG